MRSEKGGIKAWLVFALVIVIIFGGLLYIRSISKKAPEAEVTEVGKPSKPFAKPPELTEEEKKQVDSEAMGSALLSGSFEDCDKITYNEELKQKCYDNLYYTEALKSGDETLCAKIGDEALKQKCYDKVYYSAAMDAFDSDLCEKIKDESLKQSCTDQLGAIMGRTAKSASACDSIVTSRLKQECLNNYYFSSSIDALDKTGCENIMDTRLKDRCTATIDQNIEVLERSKTYTAEQSKTAEETLEICDSMGGDSAQNCKDEANYTLAFEKKDLSYCNKIIDSARQQECYKEQTENLDQFYLRQAMAERNTSVCNKIINTALKSFCTDSIQ
jgi:hypothetical protein